MPYSSPETEYFPLTLTLSLREREQWASDWWLVDIGWANSGADVIERRRTVLPLPKGEGRGEGEPTAPDPTVQSVYQGGVETPRLSTGRQSRSTIK